jgi:hypothetical protein
VVPDCTVTDGEGRQADAQLERAVDVVRSL